MEFNKEKFKNYMKIYNLTAFCEMAGLSRCTLKGILNLKIDTKDMGIKTAYKIAKMMNMSLDNFVKTFYEVE